MNSIAPDTMYRYDSYIAASCSEPRLGKQGLEIVMTTISYTECAENFSLWAEYVDPHAAMTREEFDALSIAEKVAMQVEAFGPEATVSIGSWTGPISAARELMDDE